MKNEECMKICRTVSGEVKGRRGRGGGGGGGGRGEGGGGRGRVFVWK